VGDLGRAAAAMTSIWRVLTASGSPSASSRGPAARSAGTRHFHPDGRLVRTGVPSTQLARAALGLGDVVAARSSAVEALLVARRLRNPSQMGYALELWATAELRDGGVERAGQLYALAERGTRLVSDRVWPIGAEEHR
jgi:hypothetical protein